MQLNWTQEQYLKNLLQENWLEAEDFKIQKIKSRYPWIWELTTKIIYKEGDYYFSFETCPKYNRAVWGNNMSFFCPWKEKYESYNFCGIWEIQKITFEWWIDELKKDLITKKSGKIFEEIIAENIWKEEKQFLKKSFKFESIDKLYLEPTLTNNLEIRFKEINDWFEAQAYLSCILMIWSCLEWILLGLAQNNSEIFNTAKSSPKNKDNKVRLFSEWNLNELINTAFELKFIQEDVKKHSHTLREFRNYIHPYQQIKTWFTPNKHTVEIAIQVLRATIYEVIEKNNS